MTTLREKCIKAYTEGLLKKMGAPVELLKEPEEQVLEAPINPQATDAEAVLREGAQLFSRFGLSEDRQKDLFEMPIIRKCQDQIENTVQRERQELERLFGKPRNGWKLLPFEHYKKIEPKPVKKVIPQEKIKEVHTAPLLNQSAQKQIAAIQEKLSAALEAVREVSNPKNLILPKLPVAPKTLEVKPNLPQLPDITEKRKINQEVTHHYADQLSVIIDTDRENTITESPEISATEKLEPLPEPAEALKSEMIPVAAEDNFKSECTILPQNNVVLSALRSQQQHIELNQGVAEQILNNVSSDYRPSGEAENDTEAHTTNVLRRSYGRRMML